MTNKLNEKAKENNTPEGFVLVAEGSIDEMADNIKKISEVVRRMTGPGKMNKKALSLLVREGTRYSGNVVDQKTVDRVMRAVEELDKRYITPKK